MNLANSKSGIEIPDRMRDKLTSFQKQVWIIKLAEGLLAAAFGLLVSYLLVFTLDRFFDTPALVRAAILVVGALGLGVWFPLVCHKWIWKSRKLEQVARLLKYQFPRLGDRLLGIIELVNNDEESHRSEALTRAALAQVDEETKDREFNNAVPHPLHVRWAFIAGIPAVITMAAMIWVPAAGSNAFVRWLMPWKHTERYTFAQIENLPEQLVVPVAEKSSLNATLSSGSQWTPESGLASIGGTKLSASQNDGCYEFKLPPLKEVSELTMSIGDIRETVEITPVPRPELSRLLANITLPDYLERTQPVVKDIRGGVVTMVKGSEVEFAGTATRDIAEATANGSFIQVNGPRIQTTAVQVNASSVMEFQWKDALGLTAKQPLTLKIRSESDQEPSLVCRKLEQERVIMEKDVLSFEVDASDDFGVKTIGLEWNGKVAQEANYDRSVGEKIVAAGNPESNELTAIATFSPSRLEIPPQVIQLRLFVQDYMPGRERVYSPTYTVFVLNEEDHAIWLSRQMEQWFKQSLETYEREQQLFKRNVELRNLSVEELDRPENRNQILAQAASEQAQARRLDALTEVGVSLTKEAVRNDQFDVATLEKLSNMLQRMDDITKNRMASVSDMLKQAADAASGQPSVASHGDSKPGGDDSPKVPSISTQESSMGAPHKTAGNAEQAGGGASAGGGRLSLPTVQLQDNGTAGSTNASDGPSSASQKLEGAVQAHEELLVEFQKVAEELKQIVQNLEGSTFVKRLKAMSRRQIELAQDVNETTLKEFGILGQSVKKPTKDRSELLSSRELLHRTTTENIQNDMEAYANRTEEQKFKTVLEEMKSEDVTQQLTDVSERIAANESGSSIAHLELLADTFDRWAEQLVDPVPEGGSSAGGGGASLPPSIVLEVMKILEAEIALREETRALQQAKPQLDLANYQQMAQALMKTQQEVEDRAKTVIDAIHGLDSSSEFEDEITQISSSMNAMNDAAKILGEPDTGAGAIAAESEAIEWLLQAKRSSGPLTREGEDMTISALALLGEADEQKTQERLRAVQQATGKSEKEVAEEFRYGLDKYFESLEKTQ